MICESSLKLNHKREIKIPLGLIHIKKDLLESFETQKEIFMRAL
jgi:hypothetical protein